MRKWMKDWNKLNPILAEGEVGEIIGMLDTKTGDGKTPWKDLSYTGSIPVYSDPFATSTDLATKQEAATAATDIELAAHADDVLLHTSGQELAYAENATGVTTPITGGATDIVGCVITVQSNPRPVWVEANGFADMTTAPAAGSTTQLAIQITDDLGNPVGFANASVEGGAGTGGQFNLIAKFRVPPNTPTRTYRVQAAKNGGVGAFQMMNGSISPVFRTYIAAFAA